MTVLKLNDGTNIVTDLSTDDFRKIVSQRLGDEFGKWFDDILSDLSHPETGEDWERISDGYYNALTEIYNIANDDKNKRKLAEIKRLLEGII